MINPVVSIIIPFYNPKKYFEELLDSVSKQSYQNIEVILIDDGSDKIYNDIARKFIKLASNRILITKNNGGVASARQAGIERATGELIIHADSDDLIPKFAIERLVGKILSTNSDIVIGGYIVKHSKKQHYVGVNYENYWDFVEGMVLGRYHGSLCNKLMKKSLYDSVVFETNINYMEDKLFLAKIFRVGPYKISYLDEPVYIYRQNAYSATYNLSFESISSSVIAVKIIAELYTGLIDSSLINNMLKRQRVFEIFQSAKKGLNVFTLEDKALIKDPSIQLKFRFILWVISKNLSFLIKPIVNIKFILNKLCR